MLKSTLRRGVPTLTSTISSTSFSFSSWRSNVNLHRHLVSSYSSSSLSHHRSWAVSPTIIPKRMWDTEEGIRYRTITIRSSNSSNSNRDDDGTLVRSLPNTTMTHRVPSLSSDDVYQASDTTTNHRLLRTMDAVRRRVKEDSWEITTDGWWSTTSPRFGGGLGSGSGGGGSGEDGYARGKRKRGRWDAVRLCSSVSSPPSSSSSDPDNHNKNNTTTSSSLSPTTQPSPPPKSTPTPTPTPTKPPSYPPKEKSLTTKAQTAIQAATCSLISVLIQTPGILFWYMTNPKEFKAKMVYWKDVAKKEAHHYYMGSKLLLADIRTAKQMLSTLLSGTSLTRRERKQLLRTVSDVFRVIPMSVFVLIPFMEFALPLALKLFPNMLPSTFQDSLKVEEGMKRELKSRIAMAEFFQETLQDMAKEQKKSAMKRKECLIKKQNEGSTSDIERTESHERSAASFLEFIDKARKGEMFPPEVIIQFSTYFKDDLTLDNMPRMQLINMCKYMSIPPYGNNNLLRLQLRHRIRVLQDDDQKILWEGIDSLTKMELREACQERGMRSTGLSKAAYKRSLQQWIDLSVNRNVPISLLIMSRTFFLKEELTSRRSSDVDENKSVSGLADAISGLDKEVLNEVILESATEEEKRSDPALLQLKLEVLEKQNEMIEEENKEREAHAAERAEKEQQMLLQSETATENDEDKKAATTITKEDEESKIGVSDAVQFSAHTSENVIVDKKTNLDVDTAVDDLGANNELGIVSAIDILQSDKKEKKEDKDRKPSSSFTELEAITSRKKDGDGKEEQQTEDETKLSSEEIDAISELVSPDPVSTEREKLEKLKAAMVKDDSEDQEDEGERDDVGVDDKDEEKRIEIEKKVVLESASSSAKLTRTESNKIVDQKKDQSTLVEDNIDTATVSPSEPLSSEEMDQKAKEIIEQDDRAAADEAEASTKISMDGTIPSEGNLDDKAPVISADGEEEEGKTEEQITDSGDMKLDKAIARLKTKVESMVDNIEMQLTDVEAKIGDKLHFLDKDGDGILSRDEMARVLQKVLKRTLTFEEAMAIAADMDQNQDGLFTIEELSNWLETNKLVKLVENGDHAEIDKLIAAKAEHIYSEKSDDKKEEHKKTSNSKSE